MAKGENIRLLHIMLVMFVLSPLSACGLSNGPIEGQVFEAGTHKPIAGAIVIVRWHGTYSIPFADTSSSCYHVETATTDAQGHFKTPAWTEKSKGFLFSGDYWVINMYKSDYQEYRPPSFINSDEYKKNVRFMEPFKGTREGRLEFLAGQRGKECGPRDAYVKKLLPFYRELYNEAKVNAKTSNDTKIVDSLHYSLDDLELGTNEANNKQTQGEYGP
ncbi:MAG: hypothetical protein K8R50_11935 [Betaproteobacteria bacterium]|nr:hypothetical protein [Betaproteobacteria bacterium]